MYGMLSIGIHDLIVSRFGEEVWGKIKAKAGIAEPKFELMNEYPDDYIYRLVDAAAEVLGRSKDEIMVAFGEFWPGFAASGAYGHLFDKHGNNLREFLFNLDNLHTRVGQSFPRLKPPSFRYDILDEDTLRMHYLSERYGLCQVVLGALKGLAKHFNAEIEIEHPRENCQREGAEHCEFIITFL